MFTASVADSLMPRSSDQRPDCGTSIRTTHLSPRSLKKPGRKAGASASTGAAQEKPDRDRKKQGGEDVACRFSPLWCGEERLQPACQHYDEPMHERGDADIDGNQKRQLVPRAPGLG